MSQTIAKLNFFTGAILGILGFSLAPEIIQETEAAFKTDDILTLIVGLVAIWWYNRKANDQQLSIAPIVLAVIDLIIKIGAVYIERADKEDVGDDIAVTIVLVLTLGVIIYMYQKAKKQLAA
jgi:hypothetical protein